MVVLIDERDGGQTVCMVEGIVRTSVALASGQQR
jgi:hypothetical protein